jgi:aryl-alcohol dehydrogenase-like predicted oxidoreductase
MKIILGTANFGKEYGHNKVKAENIPEILQLAKDVGITTIETAYDYGCLDVLSEHGRGFSYVYKCDTYHQWAEGESSLDRVTVKMKHHPPYENAEVIFGFGYSNIGASIYNTLNVPKANYYEIPYNVVDQRFNEFIRGRREKGGSPIIVRSVFMQGLAFSMPSFHGIPFYHLCWNFVRNNPNIDAIVVGVDSAAQLEDILSIPQYEIDYSRIGQDAWFREY